MCGTEKYLPILGNPGRAQRTMANQAEHQIACVPDFEMQLFDLFGACAAWRLVMVQKRSYADVLLAH
jgi:hypothetical protein